MFFYPASDHTSREVLERLIEEGEEVATTLGASGAAHFFVFARADFEKIYPASSFLIKLPDSLLILSTEGACPTARHAATGRAAARRTSFRCLVMFLDIDLSEMASP